MKATRLFVFKPLALALLGSTEAENLAEALLPSAPSIDAKAEARLAVSAEDVTEFAVPCAVEVAVAEAKAVVLSAWAFTPTVLRKSALASLLVRVSPEKMPDVA